MADAVDPPDGMKTYRGIANDEGEMQAECIEDDNEPGASASMNFHVLMLLPSLAGIACAPGNGDVASLQAQIDALQMEVTTKDPDAPALLNTRTAHGMPVAECQAQGLRRNGSRRRRRGQRRVGPHRGLPGGMAAST
jgi:hypothetical protein